MMICNEGSYLKIDYNASTASCEVCHESCKTCDNGQSGDCIECKSGRKALASGKTNRVYCKSCEEINPGYLTVGGDIECHGTFGYNISHIEKCGDGLYLGLVECDDGNILEGDGCSSSCTIESGYKCIHNTGLPDVCYDVRAPTATLIIKKGNMLEIAFSEEVQCEVNSTILLSTMTIWIEGAKDECAITVKPYTNFTAFSHFTKFMVQGTVPCSLKGKAETVFVRFERSELIKDLGNNALSNKLLQAAMLRYIYVSDSQAAAISGAGSSFTASSLATFGLVIGVSLLQSAAVGSFWVFVNMLQILSYVPAINCDFPYNLEVFLTDYLSVSKVSFPFAILPSWVPNPLSYVSRFVTTPFNSRFLLCGYESFNFIYNFADQLLTWLLVLLFYIVLRVLTWLIPETK